jgi:Na+-driven multidrug efflux pump
MLWGNVIMGMSMVLSGLMRASGDVLMPTVFSLTAVIGILVPSAWYLSSIYGLSGVWAGFPIAFSAMLAMQGAYYLLVWRKKSIQRLL